MLHVQDSKRVLTGGNRYPTLVIRPPEILRWDRHVAERYRRRDRVAGAGIGEHQSQWLAGSVLEPADGFGHIREDLADGTAVQRDGLAKSLGIDQWLTTNHGDRDDRFLA